MAFPAADHTVISPSALPRRPSPSPHRGYYLVDAWVVWFFGGVVVVGAASVAGWHLFHLLH